MAHNKNLCYPTQKTARKHLHYLKTTDSTAEQDSANYTTVNKNRTTHLLLAGFMVDRKHRYRNNNHKDNAPPYQSASARRNGTASRISYTVFKLSRHHRHGEPRVSRLYTDALIGVVGFYRFSVVVVILSIIADTLV